MSRTTSVLEGKLEKENKSLTFEKSLKSPKKFEISKKLYSENYIKHGCLDIYILRTIVIGTMIKTIARTKAS